MSKINDKFDTIEECAKVVEELGNAAFAENINYKEAAKNIAFNLRSYGAGELARDIGKHAQENNVQHTISFEKKLEDLEKAIPLFWTVYLEGKQIHTEIACVPVSKKILDELIRLARKGLDDEN